MFRQQYTVEKKLKVIKYHKSHSKTYYLTHSQITCLQINEAL